MAIKLSKGSFKLVSEGKHIFKITKVEYNEDFGQMDVFMQTKEGETHKEHYSLSDTNGEVNEKALNAFSYFAKTALNNFDLDEIDEQDLVGCYIEATVEHVKSASKKDPDKEYTNVKLNELKNATGFDKKAAAKPGKAKKTEPEEVEEDDDDDLDDFLND